MTTYVFTHVYEKTITGGRDGMISRVLLSGFGGHVLICMRVVVIGMG
jgi:hypothetical protein